ncbi:MAG: zinc ribbon domain-containing protein [Treponema sp.]|nr:zinc ribbon domain-containing protein [Treponema sp.]MEE3434528.1 zinc ribbon domain-containing protein [Treponema sp.]
MNKCTKCGGENTDEAKFCFFCGAPVEQKKVCVSCGEKIPNEAVFCPECGAKQIDENTDKINDKATEEKTHLIVDGLIFHGIEESGDVYIIFIKGTTEVILQGGSIGGVYSYSINERTKKIDFTSNIEGADNCSLTYSDNPLVLHDDDGTDYTALNYDELVSPLAGNTYEGCFAEPVKLRFITSKELVIWDEQVTFPYSTEAFSLKIMFCDDDNSVLQGTFTPDGESITFDGDVLHKIKTT